MATNKKLRTPLIKPRTQGGSFYTFGSAIEDIGLNINEKSNRVELTHYVLIDIPDFSADSLHANGHYDTENSGDMLFAESFQNYALNLETVARNQDNYNFTINKTCSEKVFWKWLSATSNFDVTKDGDIYHETSDNKIVKAFGQISAGAQRSDDYGIYNETFVQIPSSYGEMECFFVDDPDENYNMLISSYDCSTNIENIQVDELDSDSYIKTTGLSAKTISDKTEDESTENYKLGTKSMLSLVLDINKLRQIYNDNTLSYDDLGFGENNNYNQSSYTFNAVLVYYSIFDDNNNESLATNLYGIYIIDKATKIDDNTYSFPRLEKRKTSQSETGTSFSFRLNIKPTSAYSGDVTVIDNSTATYSMSEDFNDVLRNLNTTIRTLSNNVKVMYDLAQYNKSIRDLASQAIDKVNDLELTVNNIKHNTNKNEKIYINDPYFTSDDYLPITKDTAKQALSVMLPRFNFKQNQGGIDININDIRNLPENIQNICNSLYNEVDGKKYIDIFNLLVLLITATK